MIAQVNSRLQFVKVWRTDARTVRICMPLVLDGGVTAAWLEVLHHWMHSWRECERQAPGAPPRRRTSRPITAR